MPTPKPAKKKAVRIRQARQVVISPEVMGTPGAQGSLSEKQAFCAMVATGMPPGMAYRQLRPKVESHTASVQGGRWAKELADQIASLQQAAGQALAMAHGVTAAYLIGHAKTLLETPLAQIDANSIYCKKHKVTETMTDAGPKTTVEVEKDSPLATIQALAKLTGHDTPQALTGGQAGETGDQTSEAVIVGRWMERAGFVRPGSPIARRLAERRVDTKEASE